MYKLIYFEFYGKPTYSNPQCMFMELCCDKFSVLSLHSWAVSSDFVFFYGILAVEYSIILCVFLFENLQS